MLARPPGFDRFRFTLWGKIALVFGVVLIGAWPAMHGVMLWDDPAHLTPPEMRGWDGLVSMWTDVRATQQYYPVLFSAFWIEHRLWGDSMFGYHLLNALLHAANACLLGALVVRIWKDRVDAERRVAGWAGWSTALLFAAHPVSVESVAWVSEQKNTLSLFFCLLAALAYLRFDERRSRRVYGLATVLFLLAVGAKTATVVLPPLLLVLLWWKRGALGWRRDVAPLIPWFIVALAFGLLTSWVERTVIGAEGDIFELSAIERLLLASRVSWFFLGKLVWPPDRVFFYPRWDVTGESMNWIPFLIAALAVTVLLWALRRRTRGPLAAWLAIGGALFPALGFFDVFPFQFSYVADHFHYIAAACAFAGAASGLAWLAARLPVGVCRAGVGVGVIILVTLCGLSREQSALYVSNETLFRHNITRVPDSWMAHHILAHSIAKEPGRSSEAITHYREALRHNPGFPEAHLGLAMRLARNEATHAEAIEHYQRAVQLRPHYVEAHNNLGFLLSGKQGREVEAEKHFVEAIRLRSDFMPARLNLANLLARFPSRWPDAIAHFQAAIRLDPDLAEAHHSLGILLIQTAGQQEQALMHFEEAVRLEPRNVDALNSLAIACAQGGRFDRARVYWQRALEVDSGFDSARENLRRLDQMPRP